MKKGSPYRQQHHDIEGIFTTKYELGLRDEQHSTKGYQGEAEMIFIDGFLLRRVHYLEDEELEEVHCGWPHIVE